MATLTQVKRDHFPNRYYRKDCRRAIYQMLYGTTGTLPGRRSNDPAQDETRRFPYYWEYETAKQVFDKNISGADFSPAHKAALETRLEHLKHHKPKAD